MTRNRTVINLSRPLADQQLIGRELTVAPLDVLFLGALSAPACPQASGQLSAQRSAALDIERLDRSPHGTRASIHHRGSPGGGDQRFAPGSSTVPNGDPFAVPDAAPAMRYLDQRRSHQAAAPSQKADPAHRPAAAHSPRASRLGTLSATLSMPLGGRGPILRPAGPERGVPLQLSRDRRRRTTEPTRDRSHPRTTREQDRDLLPLGERQITPRHRRKLERRHPATLAKPPDTNARQHTRLDRSLLARCTSSDRFPEPDPMLPPPRRRMSTPTRSSRSGTTPRPVSPRHRNSSTSGVATTS